MKPVQLALSVDSISSSPYSAHAPTISRRPQQPFQLEGLFKTGDEQSNVSWLKTELLLHRLDSAVINATSTVCIQVCQNSPYRPWGLVVDTKAIKFSIGTRVRKRTVFPLHAKSPHTLFFGTTHWDSLDYGSPYVIPRSPDVLFYYTFVYMLFSWVCDPPRDVCICCCAYLRSYYSTVVTLHYSTELKVYVRHWYCVAVIHGILHVCGICGHDVIVRRSSTEL